MPDHGHHPRPNDVVLGGQNISPMHGVVLGGWDGIKQRLTSPIAEQRAAGLADALQHGPQGLNLVIRALQNKSDQVRQHAYLLLQERSEPRAKQAIERFYIQTHYGPLKRALMANNWQQADQETKLALLRLCDAEFRQHIDPIQIAGLSCRDLQLLDRLWLKYSQGRFGFSVQHSIWKKYDDLYWEKSDVWSAFGDRVGWRINNLLVHNHWKRYGEITFSQNAPVGHLPFMGDAFGIFTVEAIAKRLVCCQDGRSPLD